MRLDEGEEERTGECWTPGGESAKARCVNKPGNTNTNTKKNRTRMKNRNRNTNTNAHDNTCKYQCQYKKYFDKQQEPIILCFDLFAKCTTCAD